MYYVFAKSSFALAIGILCVFAESQAMAGSFGYCQAEVGVRTASGTNLRTASSRVVYRRVQSTPQYDLRRPELRSGANVTVFSHFLGAKRGMVLFHLAGTSMQCEIIDWQENSATIQLPRLGVAEPKNARLMIVLPDGRIAKTISVLLVSTPDVVIHEETVPNVVPPLPGGQPASYIAR